MGANSGRTITKLPLGSVLRRRALEAVEPGGVGTVPPALFPRPPLGAGAGLHISVFSTHRGYLVQSPRPALQI